MLVSYLWLQDFIEEKLPDPADIAERFSKRTLEVDGFEVVGLDHPGVIVGKIKKIEKHPNADRLQVTQVDLGTDDELVQIVCGAKNIKVGQLVPVASVGTLLPNGVRIGEAVIRDVASYGMLCSEVELGLADDSDGIMILEKGKPGQLFDEVMGYTTDVVFDIDVLPHRAADCLSHRGIAREIAGLFDLTFVDDHAPDLSYEQDPTLLTTSLDSQKGRRYLGVLIKNIEVKPSPPWLERRLKAIGERPINNIVDVTNYVMFHLGQPLHAFDASTLSQEKDTYSVGVREAKEGESITALDDVEYTLPEGALVIADNTTKDKKPIAIAGVIGGKDTAVSGATTDIILESANFDPTSVRVTAQTLKVMTNSSKRFENNPSPEVAEYAARKAVDLILEIAGTADTIVATASDEYPEPGKRPTIELDQDDITKLLGYDIDEAVTEKNLVSIGFDVERSENGHFSVVPPIERRDVSSKEDVIEEVARLYGFDQVPNIPLPKPTIEPVVNKKFYWTHSIRDLLVSQGFYEISTYTLRANGELEIENPLAKDKDHFRQTLLDGVEESVAHGLKYTDLLGIDQVRVFEIGNIYVNGEEKTMLSIGIADVKGAKVSSKEVWKEVEHVFQNELGIKLLRENAQQKRGDKIYEWDVSDLTEGLDAPRSYDPLHDLSEKIVYDPVSVYPYMLRDIALWVPNTTEAKEVEEVISDEADTDLLVGMYLFDTYQADHATSYAFRLVFQSKEKTLSDEEINEIVGKVYTTLDKHDGWETR